MKKALAISFCIMLSAMFLSSCKKDSGSTSGDQITYEVIINPNMTWMGSYFDATGAPTTISGQSSGWKVTFTNKASKPTTLSILAAPIGSIPTNTVVTANIYVNGTLVKSATSPTGSYAVELIYNLN